MEKDVPLGSVIAKRSLVDAETGGQVTISVGQPRFVGDGWDWVCPFLIEGIDEAIRGHVHGVDALQTLQLVGTAIRGALENTGRAFTFLGDPYWQGGFPKSILDLGSPALGRHLERVMAAEQTLWVRKRRGVHGGSGRGRRNRTGRRGGHR